MAADRHAAVARRLSGVSTGPLEALLREYGQALGLRAKPKQASAALAIVRRLLWSGGICTPEDLDVAAVQRYLAGLQKAGRSKKTIWNHRSAVAGFCAWLVGRGLLARNPAADVKLARPERQLPRYLDDAEIAEVLRIARARGFGPEACLALATGLRLGELIRLRWADVDLGRRCLAVRQSKSGRPRVVPLSAAALAALAEQADRSGGFAHVFPARRTWRGGWRYEDRPRASNWWRRALRPVQEAVPKFRALPGSSTGRGWHLFRHTFASRAAQGGPGRPAASIWKIAGWLGHSSVRTAEMYAHARDGYDEDIEAATPLGVAGARGKERMR